MEPRAELKPVGCVICSVPLASAQVFGEGQRPGGSAVLWLVVGIIGNPRLQYCNACHVDMMTEVTSTRVYFVEEVEAKVLERTVSVSHSQKDQDILSGKPPCVLF